MAYRNYSFVIDSSFQPFTMQEMLTPLALYKEAFEKSEDAYADLKTKADVFKDLSESLPENSKARQIYEGYANDLNTQAEDLARNGLNMGNRRALTSLKQRYSGEIGRLDRAKTALEEAKKTRSALEASGKRRLYATNNFTIDDFLDGNTPNMYSVDPDILYAKGAQRGKSVSSRMADIKEGGSMINGYFRNVIQSQGMNPQRLSQWMQSDEFSKMVDLAMIEEGVAGNLKGMDYLRAKQAYISGIFDGVVYTEKNDLQRDYDRMTAHERAEIGMQQVRQNLAERQFALETQKYADERAGKYIIDPNTNKVVGLRKTSSSSSGEDGEGKNIAINPMNIFTAKEKSNADNNIKQFSQYFYKAADGGIRMNKAGLAEYNRLYNQNTPTPTGSMMVTKTASPFKKFIDELGGADDAKNRRVGLLGNMWDKYVKSNSGDKFDGTQRTEFNYQIAEEDQDKAKTVILSAMGDRDLHELEFSEKDGRFKERGKSLSSEDLVSKDYVIVANRFSPYGNSVMIQDKEGKVKRYSMPKGINPINESNRDNLMPSIVKMQQALYTGKYVDDNGVERTLTPENRTKLQEMYTIALQNAYLYNSQIFGTNKTKPQEFTPYGY